MTDPIAIPINLFENERELVVVAPVPGVAPEDVAVDVTDAGRLTIRVAQRGAGQERISYLLREWAYGPYERSIELPRQVDARRANLSFGNGVLTISLPKAGTMIAAELSVPRTAASRGMAVGHAGDRGGATTG
jgi:HSP20 family protein